MLLDVICYSNPIAVCAVGGLSETSDHNLPPCYLLSLGKRLVGDKALTLN